MANDINTQKPDIPISGTSAIKDSIAGRKAQFIKQSIEGTGSLTLTSNSSGAFNTSTTASPVNVPDASFNDINIVDPSQVVTWPEADFYIDNDSDPNYQWAFGSSLSNEQLGIYISQVQCLTPESGNSAETIFRIKNFGVSTHTIYIHIKFKYIILADIAL